MKLRAITLRVRDIETAVSFWQRLLNAAPRRRSSTHIDLRANGFELVLLADADATPGAALPVFEYSDIEFSHYLDKARQLGATEVEDLLNDPARRSVVFADPEGNQFEISRLHD